MQLARLAVYGLLDAGTALWIRREQNRFTRETKNDLALRIPVHLTLRGPFFAHRRELDSLLRELQSLSPELPISVSLDLPSVTDGGVAWRSVVRTHSSWSKLNLLHRDLAAIVNCFVRRDDVPTHHADRGYLPHVTLGWDMRPELMDVREFHGVRPEAQIRALALAYYPKEWPRSGTVVVEELRV